MLERRAAAIEFRAAGRQLTGHAAVFDVEARLPGFTEVLKPGAFAASLRAGGDILALVDHDQTKVIGRTKAGSLHLVEDDRGLAFDINLPNTTPANDVLELVRSGNAGGASFAFSVPKDGETWHGTRRTLRSVNLIEISVVSAWPAYPETSVVARARPPARLMMAMRFLETI
jgi:Escherichia/Staphylococcus phage prohead protease